MYIDQNYYLSTYNGTSTDDFDRLEQRASEAIDELTKYRVAQQGIESLNTFQADQFKKAVAAQVEHYAVHGYETAELSNVSIGSFSYTENEKANDVSSQAINHLKPTGLLYAGLSQ